MVEIVCNYCDANKTRLIKEEGEWGIVQCRNCGLVYVNPQPDESFLRVHYQSYLPEIQKEIDDWQIMMSRVFLKAWHLILNSKGFKGTGRLLDIGCGHGFFLEQAIKRGWDAYGIDLSEQAVQYASKKGLNVTKTTLFDKQYKNEEFDVITMFYVLEHVSDPIKYLHEINRILKSNGLLVLRVPHTTPIAELLKIVNISNKLYDAPSHLFDFSPSITKKVLEKTGFINIKTSIGGMTYPHSFLKRVISYVSGNIAEFMYTVSSNTYLMPGVSKTTIAYKI